MSSTPIRPSRRRSEAISPTAHYTGFVWARNGLSDPAFATTTGRVFYHSLRPVVGVSERFGGPSLERFLLARHRIIDHLLDEAIQQGRVSQVIEVAAGLSPRGWRFTQRYGDALTYVETDLPDMARRKRALLDRTCAGRARPRVAELNVLHERGEHSLAELAGTLDESQGLAIITEGLLNYFDRDSVLGMWSRFAGALRPFSDGLYLSDLLVSNDNAGRLTSAFAGALSMFVRGRVHLHFDDHTLAVDALREAGFGRAVLHSPPEFAGRVAGCDRGGVRQVRVIDASVSGS